MNNTDKIRGLLEKEIRCTTDNAPLKKILSLLPKPCEKTFNCKHFRGYSQPVPIPFGVGNCSEPLGDCAIESESEDCCLECPDYKESACQVPAGEDVWPSGYHSESGKIVLHKTEVPAGEIEEFVKTVRHKLLDVALYCGGLPEMTQVFQDLKQACDHLTAQSKRCEQLEGENKKLRALLKRLEVAETVINLALQEKGE